MASSFRRWLASASAAPLIAQAARIDLSSLPHAMTMVSTSSSIVKINSRRVLFQLVTAARSTLDTRLCISMVPGPRCRPSQSPVFQKELETLNIIAVKEIPQGQAWSRSATSPSCFG